jgi:hypothetical protein
MEKTCVTYPWRIAIRLRSILPPRGERLLYCDHVELAGEEFFQLACERDLEGIVAKRKFDPYLAGSATWLKIRNPKYSQWIGREELFERERRAIPIGRAGTSAPQRVMS